MLANKYLKYRPEITLEIFTLVWNKLFANGWYNTECDNCDREYDEFSGKYPILKDQENKDFYSEEASEQIKKLTETTVQEILGYNPFEDDFKLERNWQIKTTNEVIEELQKHDILYEVNYSYTPNAYYGMNNGYKFGQIGVKQNVQMITLEQLKQYVLKTTEQPKVMETKVESKPIEKWSVGSYIVFLQDEVLTRSGKVTKGKPYVLTTGGYIPYFTDDNSFTINFNSKKYESYGLQWFATLQEAEMFAKTLVEPVKEEVAKSDKAIEDAKDAVEAAYQNITPENVINNAAMTAYSAEFWRNVNYAEQALEQLEKEVEEATKLHDAKVKELESQIGKYKARIAKISKVA